MRLHELYFGNLGGKEPLGPDSRLMQKIVERLRQLREVGRGF
jgi:hypothetical protein